MQSYFISPTDDYTVWTCNEAARPKTIVILP